MPLSPLNAPPRLRPRRPTGIPVGDLFTVMESWQQDSRILAAMTTILDIEAHAAAAVSAKPGLMQLLQLLRDRKVRRVEWSEKERHADPRNGGTGQGLRVP